MKMLLVAALFMFSANIAAEGRLTPDADKSCRELSLEIEILLASQQKQQAGYFALPGTRIAANATVVFKPAWFYLGYAAIRHLQNVTDGPGLLARIKRLRTEAADKRCYVR